MISYSLVARWVGGGNINTPPTQSDYQPHLSLMPSRFNFNQKSAYLTYPNCSLSKERVKDFFVPFGMKEYAICKELHQNGEPHIHALIIFDKKFHTRNCRVFDIDGHHPNIQGCRSKNDTFRYIRKDGDFITNIGFKRTYGDLMRENDTGEDFMKAAKREMPRDYVLNHEKLEYFCNKNDRAERELYQPRYEDFPNELPEMVAWGEMIGEPNLPDRPKTLILCGPSRTGKTEWARAIGRHLYFNGLFNLDDWDEQAEYIIMDDMNIKYLPNYKAWFGAQSQFTLTDKYRKKKTVKWGKPLIWICNDGEDPRKSEVVNREWMDENSIFVQVNDKLY